MGQFSLANLFGITLRESANDGSDFTNPDADYRRVFLGEDGALHAKDSSGTVTALGASGAVTSSGLTMATARLLGRTTASSGAVEEITVGSGLSLSAGSLTATGGSAIPNLFVGSMHPFLATTVSNAPTANRAYLVKFIPTADITVDTANWNCNTSAGNLDFGIYNADFSTRLGSTGSFASPGTGARTQALTGSVAMTAGTVYYLAAAFSSASLRVPMALMGTPSGAGSTGWNLYGREESAFPLPASIAAVDAWEDGATVPAFYFTT